MGFILKSKPTKGVEKNAPEKKPFFRFIELFKRKFWRLIELNLIYILFCIPIITFGPATAALTHIMRQFYLERPVFIFHDFLTAFKKNFKASIGIGIADLLVFFGAWFALSYYQEALQTSEYYWLLVGMLVAAIMIFTIMNFYIYLEIVALNLKMKAILKNAFFLSSIAIVKNLFTFMVSAVIIMVVFMVIPVPYNLLAALLFPFSWIAFLSVFNTYPVIQKYVINPYYEERGEVNPELKTADTSNAVFEDMGGKEEAVVTGKPRGGKNVIK